MGLDVSAYSKLTKVDCVFDADGDPIDPITREPLTYGADYNVRPYINRDFPGRAAGVEGGSVYKAEGCDAYYSAGYGRYNAWRDQLAQLAGYSGATGAWDTEAGPFWELINFSDCEGTIGPVVSVKLAKDFVEWDARAARVGGDFYASYQLWRRMFEAAADDGMVRFS